MRVEIRGVIYESVAEAAREIGVHPSTIRKALDRGTIDKVGLWRKGVTIRGTYYRTQKEAAQALGVSQGNVSEAMAQGWLDRLGTGKNRPQPTNGHRSKAAAKRGN